MVNFTTMPRCFTFSDSEGKSLPLIEVDNEIWRFLDKEPDPNHWTKEYHHLTDFVVMIEGGLSGVLEVLKEAQMKRPTDSDDLHYVQLVQHLIDKGWSVTTGWGSKSLLG